MTCCERSRSKSAPTSRGSSAVRPSSVGRVVGGRRRVGLGARRGRLDAARRGGSGSASALGASVGAAVDAIGGRGRARLVTLLAVVTAAFGGRAALRRVAARARGVGAGRGSDGRRRGRAVRHRGRRRLVGHHARRLRERALDHLVHLDELAAPGAQLRHLPLELLAALAEVGEHAVAHGARLADDLVGTRPRRVLHLACLRVGRLLGRRAELARALLRLARPASRACSSAFVRSSTADSRAWPSTRAVSSPSAAMRSWSDGGGVGIASRSSSDATRAASSRARLAAEASSSATRRRYARTSFSAYPRLTWLNERSATSSGFNRESRDGTSGVPEVSDHALMIAPRSSWVAALPRRRAVAGRSSASSSESTPTTGMSPAPLARCGDLRARHDHQVDALVRAR